jgi:hypothetical protein
MENKTSKYLKYAIGEIVLVVIGILIALQINNWNEHRKDSIKEKVILQDISTSLTSDIQNMIDPNLEQLGIDIENMNAIVATFKNRDSLTPQLKKRFKSLMYSKSFKWEVTAYKNLENEGANIIKNKFLKDAIIRIYNTDYPDCENLMKNFADNLIAFFRPEMRDKFLFDYDSEENIYIPINYDELLEDTKFMNTVVTAKINFINNFNAFSDTKKNVEKVIDLIEQELNN